MIIATMSSLKYYQYNCEVLPLCKKKEEILEKCKCY